MLAIVFNVYNWLLMIETNKVNVKHKIYYFIAEFYALAEGHYNAHLTFMNVANLKQANFSTGCFLIFHITYIINMCNFMNHGVVE